MSQIDAALDVADVVVEVVQNAAVGRIGQTVEHPHHRFAHVVKLPRSRTPLGRLETHQRATRFNLQVRFDRF